MTANRQAYEDAYQRALQGRTSRGFLERLTGIFEDDYTRRSREKGERDGLAARAGEAERTAPEP